MIRLYSYKNNFGDDLSPYIISKLSGEEVVYRKPFSIKRFSFDFLRFIKQLVLKGSFDRSLLSYSPFQSVIISIGSILEEATANSVVWGSGLGSKDIKIKGGEFRAVRGPLSQKRLTELGFNAPDAIGDPAILLPLIYPNNNKGITNIVGIIPHKSDFKKISTDLLKTDDKNLLIIDLTDPDLEQNIDNFLSCDYILSSSLHGLIVAHAYGIPALWFEEGKLFGDGSKFDDYFLSVGILSYEPLKLKNIGLDLANIRNLFNSHSKISMPIKDISVLQDDLIRVAPFNVINKYK
jgi:pyruvyltransferase